MSHRDYKTQETKGPCKMELNIPYRQFRRVGGPIRERKNIHCKPGDVNAGKGNRRKPIQVNALAMKQTVRFYLLTPSIAWKPIPSLQK